MIKAVFFDCDGTLYSHQSNRVPPSTVQAISLLQQKGILCILCTGRVGGELSHLGVDRIPFDYEILLNGALVLKKGEVIFQTPITQRDKETTLSYLKKKETSIQFIEKDRMYMNLVNSTATNCLQAIHTEIPPLDSPDVILNRDIYQMIVYGMEQAEELVSLLQDCKCFRWTKEQAIDINHKNAGKGTGMAYLEEVLSLKREEIMAFGDAENDIEMLQRAGISVAMGNGEECVKNIAKEVTKDIDEDGIAYMLQKYHLL